MRDRTTDAVARLRVDSDVEVARCGSDCNECDQHVIGVWRSPSTAAIER